MRKKKNEKIHKHFFDLCHILVWAGIILLLVSLKNSAKD